MVTTSKERPRRARKKAKPEAVVREKLILPTEANVPPERLSDSVVMIYGRKGIGKSSLAAQFPNALTFMFERGRRNLPIMQLPKKGENKLTWAKFVDYVELFLESDFKTAVIDTIDRAYLCCYEHVCKQAGVNTPDEHQASYTIWDNIAGEFESVLSMIQDSDKGLVLLSHEKARPLIAKIKGLRREDEDSTFVYERLEPSCKPAAFRYIQEICDFVFYYGFADEFRCLTVRSPNDIAWTSCGMSDTFLDPDGKPVSTFKVGTSADEAYLNLNASYNNELFDVDHI